MFTLIFCAVTGLLPAQNESLKEWKFNDPIFPARGRFNAGVLGTYSPITPPPALIGDVTYGVSNNFSIGIAGGTTGALALFGIKLNAVIAERENFRIAYRMITVLYPERHGKFLFDRKDKHVMPWMLSMGVVDGEWRFENGIRTSIGMGLLETHCVEDMKYWFNGHHHPADETGEHKFFDLFTTAQAAVSIPVSKRFTLRPEIFGVFKKGKLIEREVYKIPFPINGYLSVIYSF